MAIEYKRKKQRVNKKNKNKKGRNDYMRQK